MIYAGTGNFFRVYAKEFRVNRKTYFTGKKTFFGCKKTGFSIALCFYIKKLSALSRLFKRIWGDLEKSPHNALQKPPYLFFYLPRT
jgi:hypothetical protein